MVARSPEAVERNRIRARERYRRLKENPEFLAAERQRKRFARRWSRAAETNSKIRKRDQLLGRMTRRGMTRVVQREQRKAEQPTRKERFRRREQYREDFRLAMGRRRLPSPGLASDWVEAGRPVDEDAIKAWNELADAELRAAAANGADPKEVRLGKKAIVEAAAAQGAPEAPRAEKSEAQAPASAPTGKANGATAPVVPIGKKETFTEWAMRLTRETEEQLRAEKERRRAEAETHYENSFEGKLDKIVYGEEKAPNWGPGTPNGWMAR